MLRDDKQHVVEFVFIDAVRCHGHADDRIGQHFREAAQTSGQLGELGEEMDINCTCLDLIGQSSDLGVRLRASDRSAQQATATGWLC